MKHPGVPVEIFWAVGYRRIALRRQHKGWGVEDTVLKPLMFWNGAAESIG
ncbi:MAG: hypothetical protein SFY68_16000 [Candidatus Sumerlaeia bacterium]|nr:hypothetical protein [Candidatus Sumerlaeia bacterium]